MVTPKSGLQSPAIYSSIQSYDGPGSVMPAILLCCTSPDVADIPIFVISKSLALPPTPQASSSTPIAT